MTTKFLDNKFCTFKILLSWRFPRKTAFLDNSSLYTHARPPKNVQILFLLSSRSLWKLVFMGAGIFSECRAALAAVQHLLGVSFEPTNTFSSPPPPPCRHPRGASTPTPPPCIPPSPPFNEKTNPLPPARTPPPFSPPPTLVAQALYPPNRAIGIAISYRSLLSRYSTLSHCTSHTDPHRIDNLTFCLHAKQNKGGYRTSSCPPKGIAL